MEILLEEKEWVTIRCGTGCTCCNWKDHVRGPYSSKAEAERRLEKFKKVRLLGSQYAPDGRYYMFVDGRYYMFVDSHRSSVPSWDVREDGSIAEEEEGIVGEDDIMYRCNEWAYSLNS